MDKVEAYEKLLHIHQQVSELKLFPALGWVWTFDILHDIWTENQFEDVKDTEWVDECIPAGVSLREIFDKFYDDIDSLDLNMDQGGEILEEVIRDWMRDNEFLVALDNDGWLENV